MKKIKFLIVIGIFASACSQKNDINQIHNNDEIYANFLSEISISGDLLHVDYLEIIGDDPNSPITTYINSRYDTFYRAINLCDACFDKLKSTSFKIRMNENINEADWNSEYYRLKQEYMNFIYSNSRTPPYATIEDDIYVFEYLTKNYCSAPILEKGETFNNLLKIEQEKINIVMIILNSYRHLLSFDKSDAKKINDSNIK